MDRTHVSVMKHFPHHMTEALGRERGVSCLEILDGKCGEIGLNSEGNALKFGLGGVAIYTWGVGLLAAGQASTMTATYAGQIIMGGCLEIQMAPWKRVAFTRAIALGPSISVAAATNSRSGLYNTINEYLNVLQSVQLPFAMLPLLHFSVQEHIMGRFRSPPLVMMFNCFLAILVMAINVVLTVQSLEGMHASHAAIVTVCTYAALYLCVCFRMVWTEIVALLLTAKRLLCGGGDGRDIQSSQRQSAGLL